jgi:putative spermidine/putrescine transport system permease protein
MKLSPQAVSLLQVAPFALVLLVFVVVPLALVLVVSFFEFDMITGVVPAFTLQNYVDIFASPITVSIYLDTLRYALIVWAITLVLGFWIAYFLVFHVRSLTVAIGLFLVCTVPFWTSNIIRMISWVPLLGKFGLVNQTLMGLGIAGQPVEWLLFSDFAVIVAYVHLFTLFMIVPIFNSMARIDPAIVEAAVDGGASRWGVIREIVIPLSRTGIALGSIFVIALVMGDFFVVKVMSGGRSASVVSTIFEDINLLFYPTAAANAVILLIIVLLMVSAILRIVDVRRELAG